MCGTIYLCVCVRTCVYVCACVCHMCAFECEFVYMHVYKHLRSISLRQTGIVSFKTYSLFSLFLKLYFRLLSLTVILSPAQQLHSHLSPVPHPNPQFPSAYPHPSLLTTLFGFLRAIYLSTTL